VHVAVCRAHGRSDAVAFFRSLEVLVRRHVGVPLAWVGELERDDIAGGLQQPLQTSAREAGAAFLRRVTSPARAGVMRA
jgi:flagellar biosynthesis protein FlhG